MKIKLITIINKYRKTNAILITKRKIINHLKRLRNKYRN